MHTKYQSSYTDIFIRVLLFVFFGAPLIFPLILFGNGELSLKYFPLQIIAGIALMYVFKYLLASDLKRFKTDILNKKITPLLTFNYEEEEWKHFISGMYNIRKNSLYKITLVMVAITLLLFYFKKTATTNGNEEVIYTFSLMASMITINFIVYFYLHLVRPLKTALNSSEREIDIYKQGVYIPVSRYMIITFDINHSNHLIGINRVDDDKNLCFSYVVHDEESSTHKTVTTKILIPKKEYKNMSSNKRKLQKMY